MEIRLFGTIEVRRGGEALELEGLPARRLLVWLALHGGAAGRDHVAAQLWPAQSSVSARRNLRHALFTLRSALGEQVVVSTRTTIALAPEVRSDVGAYRRLLDAGRYERALELFHGQIAPGVSDEWLHDLRSDWQRRAGEIAGRFAVQAEAARNLRGAIHWGRRAVELDPLDEAATRRLMRLLAAANERAAALAAYRRLSRGLMREFSTGPSMATRKLAGTVRGDDAGSLMER